MKSFARRALTKAQAAERFCPPRIISAAGFFFCAFYERAEAIHWQRVEKGWKEAGNSVIIAS